MAGAYLDIREDLAETQGKGNNPLPKLPSREEFLGHGVRFLCSTGKWIRDVGAKASSQLTRKQPAPRGYNTQKPPPVFCEVSLAHTGDSGNNVQTLKGGVFDTDTQVGREATPNSHRRKPLNSWVLW